MPGTILAVAIVVCNKCAHTYNGMILAVERYLDERLNVYLYEICCIFIHCKFYTTRERMYKYTLRCIIMQNRFLHFSVLQSLTVPLARILRQLARSLYGE